jgi:hypothetical protein
VASSEGGDQPVQVSPGAAPDERNPQWSPDGRRLAWTAIENGVVRAQVARRSAQGWSAPREVASPGAAIGSSWADTAELLAVDTVNRRVVLVDVDNAGRPPRTLTGVLPDSMRGGLSAVSSDYRTIYVHNRHGLWVLPASGGVPREVVRFDDPLHPHTTNARGVSGYAGFLYFTLQNPQSNIWVARVTGLKR